MFRWFMACAALVLLGVSPGQAAEAVFPLGSHFGLAPPGDMKPSIAFRGFEDRDSNASMLIVEVPPQNAAEVEKELNAATLKKQGLAEDTRETVPLKAGKGLLIVGDQEADNKKLRKWIFFASAPEGAALIAVQVPEAAKSKYSDADMRAALVSTIVRASVPMTEQLRLVPFAFDELSGLRPFRVLGNTTVFLTDGATDPQDAAAQPLLIVSIAPGGPEQPSDRDNFSRRLFGSLVDFKDVRIVGSDVLRLNNMPTYEIQAEAKDPKSDAPIRLVQWIRFGNGAFLRFVGISRGDAWRDAFPKFRAVRDGVKPRG
jgi:hypothetical protein